MAYPCQAPLITETDFADIVDIGLPLVDKWASEAYYFEPYDDDDPPSSLQTISTEGLSMIYKSNIEQAILDIAESKASVNVNIRRRIQTALNTDDWGDLDAIDADAIIQVACFNKIIFS